MCVYQTNFISDYLFHKPIQAERIGKELITISYENDNVGLKSLFLLIFCFVKCKCNFSHHNIGHIRIVSIS